MAIWIAKSGSGKRLKSIQMRTDPPNSVKQLAASEREIRKLRRDLAHAKALLDLQKKFQN